MRKVMVLAVAALLGVAAGCGGDDDAGGDETLVVYSGREEELVEPLFERFEQETGIDVEVRYGDSAELAATIAEEGDNSPADVFFAQDPGSLGAVEREGRLAKLPQEALDRVPARFRDPDGHWVGTSGRSRVIAYNTDALSEDEVPDSVFALTDPKWKGKIGIAPTNASFQAFVSAMLLELGEERTRTWLEGLKANEPKLYEKNTPVVEAVGSGEIELGLVNHYYLYLVKEENPERGGREPLPHGRGSRRARLGRGRGDPRDRRSRGRSAAVRRVPALRAEPALLRRRGGGGRVPGRAGHRGQGRPPAARQPGRAADPARPARPRAREDARAAERGRVHDVSRTRAPVALAVPAVAAVALVVLPLVYLLLRTVGSGDVLEVLGRPGTTTLVVKTLVLVVAVTGTAVLVGLPLAWFVTRTDLPARRVLAIAAPLPLVIPSYVAALALLGAFGPRGLLQQLLEPLGVERLPEIYGFVGAWLALTLSTYPYVFLLAGAALRGLDPALEDAARGLGRSRWGVFRRVTLPALRPSLGAASLLVALYTLSDFGAVSLMQYNALTRSIYVQYRSLFDRTPAAVLALVLVAFAAVLLVLEERSRRGVRASAERRRATAEDDPARAMALARIRVLRERRRVLPRRAARRARLLDRARRRARPRGSTSPGRRRSRPSRLPRSLRSSRSSRCFPSRCSPSATRPAGRARSSDSLTPATRCPGS